MTIYEKEFTCRRCGIKFRLCSRKAFYCHSCGKKIRSAAAMQKRAAQNPSIALGVGSGGNQQGIKNHHFIDGMSNYKRNYERANPGFQSCEICASTQNVVIHHIDQNRKNNQLKNLMPICRSCHAQIHRVVTNLGVVPLLDADDENYSCMEAQPFPEFDIPITAEAAVGARFGDIKEVRHV